MIHPNLMPMVGPPRWSGLWHPTAYGPAGAAPISIVGSNTSVEADSRSTSS